MTQARLRAAASTKFGPFAQGMLFTQDGLEQATRLAVAAHHAQRYVGAGVTSVADLTCGLGADAMAFASLGLSVLAFELDEATALFADHNLRHWDNARVVHADAMLTLASGSIDAQALFVDPARRDGRGRRHDPRDYSPPLDDVLGATRSAWPDMGLKLGPALPHDAVPPEAEAQWVSVDGDVVELGVWSGEARAHARTLCTRDARYAGAYLGRRPRPRRSWPPGRVRLRARRRGHPGRTRGASRRAHRREAHRSAHRLPHVRCTRRDSLCYGLSSARVPALFGKAACFGARVAQASAGSKSKSAGMDIDPAALRPRLKLKGSASATVILTRVGETRLALIAERVT